MKFWLKAQLEHGERYCCSDCKQALSFPSLCFVEVQFVQGSLPHPDELHPDLTARKLCENCGGKK
jgi:hypothetical protein